MEEMFPVEPESDPRRLSGVDLTEYYGGRDFSKARRIVVSQLKYSHRRAGETWTAARLCEDSPRISVIRRLAEIFVDLSASERDRDRLLKVLSIRLVSNKPIGKRLKASLAAADDLLALHPDEMRFADLVADIPASCRDDIRRLYRESGLASRRFTDFLRLLKLDVGQLPRGEQELAISEGLGRHVKADLEHHSRALYELVRRRALPEGRALPIGIEDVLAALGVHGTDALFPAPPAFASPVGPVVRTKEPARILDRLRAAEGRKLIAHGDAGVGKTTSALELGRELDDGSVLIAFDCYAGRDYMNPAHARHLPERALVQLCNELATRCRLPMLVVAPRSSADLWRELEQRLAAAAHTMSAVGAAVLVVIDAIDNAAWAATQRGDPSFVSDLWTLKIPEGAGLVVTARTSRLGLLEAPAGTPNVELRGFDLDGSTEFLRHRFPQADDAGCERFHENSQGNPRVQSYVLETVEDDTEEALAKAIEAADLTPRNIFEDLWETAGKHSGNEERAIERLADLMCLTPPVELRLLGEVAESDHDAELFCRALVPGLRLEGDRVVIRDEDFEKFLEDKLDPGVRRESHARLADLFWPRAEEDPYAAQMLAGHLYGAGRHVELQELAIDAGEPQVFEDPLTRLQVFLERVRLALRSLAPEQRMNAAKLLVLAARAVTTDEAVTRIIRQRPDLALRYGDPESVAAVWRDDRNLGWQGPVHMRLAAIAAARGDGEEARAALRSTNAWLIQRHERENRWDISAADLAAALEAVVLLDGWDAAIDRLKEWEPREFTWEVAEALVTRLRPHRSGAELGASILATDAPVDLRARLLVALGEDPEVLPTLGLTRLARDLARGGSVPEKGSPGWPTEFAELVARRTGDRRLVARLLRSVGPSIPRSAPSHTGDGRRFLWVLRSRTLRAVCEGKGLQIDDLMPAAVTELEGQELDSKQESRLRSAREAMRLGVEPLLSIYMRRAKALLRPPMAHSIRPTLAKEIPTFADRQHRDWNSPGVTYAEWARPAVELLSLARGRSPEVVGQIVAAAQDDLGRNNSWVWQQVAGALLPDPRYREQALTLVADAASEVESRTQPAADLTDALLDLAELAGPYDASLAADLYTRAVVAASGLDDEAVVALEMHAQLAEGLSASPAAPTLARRLGDAVVAYRPRVSEEAYLPWRPTLEAVTRLHPASGIALMSRWEDERHLRISDSAKWVAFAAVEAGFLEPGDGLSLLVLSGDGAADIWPALDLLDRIAATGDRAGLVAEVDRLSLVIRKDLLPRPRRVLAASLYSWAGSNGLSESESITALRPYFELPERDRAGEPDRPRRGDLTGPPRRDPPPVRSDGEPLEAWLSRVGDGTTRPGEVLAALEETADRLGQGERVTIFEAIAALPTDHSLFVYSSQTMLEFLNRQLDRWSTTSGVRRWRQEHLPRLLTDQATNFLRFRESSDRCLAEVAELIGAEGAVQFAIDVAEADVERLRPDSLYALATRVALALGPEQSCGFLDWSLRHFEEGEVPTEPIGVETRPEVLAGLLWALFANPEKHVRWWAAHAGRRLIMADGGAAIASVLLDLAAARDGGGAFSCSGLPFLAISAQTWALMLLARIAGDRPEILAARWKDLAAIACDRSWPHVVVGEFARRAALAIAGSPGVDLPEEDHQELLLANRPRACLARKQSHHLGGGGPRRTESRWPFGMDTEDYWYAGLARRFDVGAATVAEAAERWLIDRLGESPQAGGRGEDTRIEDIDYSLRTNHHGSRPAVETRRTALEYHAMHLVAGELLDEARAVIVEDYSPVVDPWEEWLVGHVDQFPQFWISDLRDPTPPEPGFLCAPVGEGRWHPIEEHQFELALGHPTAGAVVVDGYLEYGSEVGYGYDSIHSALVTPATGASLRRALQGAENMSFLEFPTGDVDDEFHDGWLEEEPFGLIGWLKETRREREGMEAFDPLARISASASIPGGAFRRHHGASLRADESLLDAGGKRVAWVRRFSDVPLDERRSSSSGYAASGRQTFVTGQALLSFLKSVDRSLILKLGLTRRPRSSEIEEREDGEEIHRAVLIEQSGRIEGLRGSDSLG